MTAAGENVLLVSATWLLALVTLVMAVRRDH